VSFVKKAFGRPEDHFQRSCVPSKFFTLLVFADEFVKVPAIKILFSTISNIFTDSSNVPQKVFIQI
jgi:hypothetical protein